MILYHMISYDISCYNACMYVYMRTNMFILRLVQRLAARGPALGNFTSQDFNIYSARFWRGFVASANLRNCWSFYRREITVSAILRKTSTEIAQKNVLAREMPCPPRQPFLTSHGLHSPGMGSRPFALAWAPEAARRIRGAFRTGRCLSVAIITITVPIVIITTIVIICITITTITITPRMAYIYIYIYIYIYTHILLSLRCAPVRILRASPRDWISSSRRFTRSSGPLPLLLLLIIIIIIMLQSSSLLSLSS